jgi:hypothetical protein
MPILTIETPPYFQTVVTKVLGFQGSSTMPSSGIPSAMTFIFILRKETHFLNRGRLSGVAWEPDPAGVWEVIRNPPNGWKTVPTVFDLVNSSAEH